MLSSGATSRRGRCRIPAGIGPSPSPSVWLAIGYDDFSPNDHGPVWLKLSTNQILIQTNPAYFLQFTIPNGTVSGTGDFDRNAIADLVSRDNDGGVRVHLLNSDGTRKALYRLGLLPTNFIVTGAVDMTKDGMPDILIRNTTTGRVFVWTTWYDQTNGLRRDLCGRGASRPLRAPHTQILDDARDDTARHSETRSSLRATRGT